ncbi:MAG: hypothetical protein ACI4JY_05305 [Oscillospiraceae bacterium]
MRKILSAILSVTILVGCISLPVFADYTAAEYDAELLSETYDSGTKTNSIDNSSALYAEDKTAIFTLSDNTTLTKEFFLSFDFCFYTDSDDAVNGVISIDQKKSNGDTNKQGPLFSYSNGQLRTQTGSDKYANLGEISPDTWYTAELEGKMVVTSAKTAFRLYKHENGDKTLVNQTDALDMRQFYAGSGNGNPDRMFAQGGVGIDNVKLIQEYPDTITIMPESEQINAGQSTALDYTMTRAGTETTKYSVAWSVYDETNTTEITDGSIKIENGALISQMSNTDLTVTIHATAVLGEKTLIGTLPYTIKGVSTQDEKFDEITIVGDDEVKAGTSTQYAFTAKKNGSDVTDTITNDDVEWSVYNAANLKINGNKGITVENGTLTIDGGVIAQDITLRASTPNGAVYGSKTVSIGFSDAQTETILGYNACEETLTGTKTVVSIDGSNAYQVGDAALRPETMTFSASTEYVLTELDVKFAEEDSGFTLSNTSSNMNTGIRRHNGKISVQTASSSYTDLMDADADSWYHFEIVYSQAQNNASVNIYKYNGYGTLGERNTFADVNTRNNKAYNVLYLEKNTCIDNVKVSVPIADSVTLTSSSNTAAIGGTVQITAEASRLGLDLINFSGLEWSVLDSDNMPIIDGTVTISTTGLLKVSSSASAQTVKVQVKSGSYTVSTDIEIIQSDIFTVNNIGINEEGTKIVKLYVEKMLDYDDDMVILLAFYNSDGILTAVHTFSGYGSNYQFGENEITVDWEIPSDFNPEKDKVTSFIWSSL